MQVFFIRFSFQKVILSRSVTVGQSFCRGCLVSAVSNLDNWLACGNKSKRREPTSFVYSKKERGVGRQMSRRDTLPLTRRDRRMETIDVQNVTKDGQV